MEQRTCNIIMCCKGHCRIPGGTDCPPLDSVAAYMARECGCPQEDYKGNLMERIMSEAMFDYLDGARKPGFELRQMFHSYFSKEPSMSERIAVMFQLTQIRDDDGYVNGFTQEQIDKSEIALAETEATT